jgi:hypothetical protein
VQRMPSANGETDEGVRHPFLRWYSLRCSSEHPTGPLSKDV